MGRRKAEIEHEAWLPFDFLEQEAERRREALERGRNANPETDDEKMMDTQARYKLDGDQRALADYYAAAAHAARNFARTIAKKAAPYMSRDDWETCAIDAAEEMTAELAKPARADGSDFWSEKCPTAYLYLRTRTLILNEAGRILKERPTEPEALTRLLLERHKELI